MKINYLFLGWIGCLASYTLSAQIPLDHGLFGMAGIMSGSNGFPRDEGFNAIGEVGYDLRAHLNRHVWLGTGLRYRQFDRTAPFTGPQSGVLKTTTGSSALSIGGEARMRTRELALPLTIGIHPSERLPLTVMLGVAVNFRLHSKVQLTYDITSDMFDLGTFSSVVVASDVQETGRFLRRNRAVLPVAILYPIGRCELGFYYQVGLYRTGLTTLSRYRYISAQVGLRYRLSARPARSLALFNLPGKK